MIDKINVEIQKAKKEGADVGQISDGYHTFDELYEHRCRLFVALINTIFEWDFDFVTWKSWKHDDNTGYEGWFIAGIRNLNSGEQITYHLPARLWDNCSVPEVEKSEKWDGHTANEVLERLLRV